MKIIYYIFHLTLILFLSCDSGGIETELNGSVVLSYENNKIQRYWELGRKNPEELKIRLDEADRQFKYMPMKIENTEDAKKIGKGFY